MLNKQGIQRIITKYRVRLGERAYLTPDFDKEMLFVVTPGRSGSTLLRRHLMEYFFVHIPPESSEIIPLGVQLFTTRYRRVNDQVLIAKVVASLSASEFCHWNLTDSELLDFLDCKPDARGELKLDQLIYGFYDLHRKKFNPDAILIGDKTPYLVYYLDIISSIFKRAKYIFLLRHPFAAVASRMSQFSEPLEPALNRWVSAVRSIERSDAFRSGSGVVVKYEDMVEAPLRTLQMLGDKLGLKGRPTKPHFDEQALGDIVLEHHSRARADNIIGDRNRSLKDQLSQNELKVIADRTRRYLKLFDYHDDRH
jgi:hypothetical protein